MTAFVLAQPVTWAMNEERRSPLRRRLLAGPRCSTTASSSSRKPEERQVLLDLASGPKPGAATGDVEATMGDKDAARSARRQGSQLCAAWVSEIP